MDQWAGAILGAATAVVACTRGIKWGVATFALGFFAVYVNGLIVHSKDMREDAAPKWVPGIVAVAAFALWAMRDKLPLHF